MEQVKTMEVRRRAQSQRQQERLHLKPDDVHYSGNSDSFVGE